MIAPVCDCWGWRSSAGVTVQAQAGNYFSPLICTFAPLQCDLHICSSCVICTMCLVCNSMWCKIALDCNVCKHQSEELHRCNNRMHLCPTGPLLSLSPTLWWEICKSRCNTYKCHFKVCLRYAIYIYKSWVAFLQGFLSINPSGCVISWSFSFWECVVRWYNSMPCGCIECITASVPPALIVPFNSDLLLPKWEDGLIDKNPCRNATQILLLFIGIQLNSMESNGILFVCSGRAHSTLFNSSLCLCLLITGFNSIN